MNNLTWSNHFINLNWPNLIVQNDSNFVIFSTVIAELDFLQLDLTDLIPSISNLIWSTRFNLSTAATAVSQAYKSSV